MVFMFDDGEHLDWFAERDLCSGDVEAGDGSGEERVWLTCQFYLEDILFEYLNI